MDTLTEIRDKGVSMVSETLPQWAKIDNIAQSLVLWFALDYLVLNITTMEKIWVIGVNSLTHGLLHDASCFFQKDIEIKTSDPKPPQINIF